MAVGKRYRQGHILNLIASETIKSQEGLRQRLAQTGIRVTQATLSRDLHELKVVKGVDGYLPPSLSPTDSPQHSLTHAAKEFLLDLRPVQNLLVLRTPAGGAQTLALALDAEGWKEIAGTLGGDDTVLVICTSPRARATVQRRLEHLVR